MKPSEFVNKFVVIKMPDGTTKPLKLRNFQKQFIDNPLKYLKDKKRIKSL